MREALTEPVVLKRYAELGRVVEGNSHAEFAAMPKAKLPRWKKMVATGGIHQE